MQMWQAWLDGLRAVLDFLALDLGLGAGLAIVVATLLLRLGLLPVTWTSAYRGALRSRKLKVLQPELERIRERCADAPDRLLVEMQGVYRRHGVTPFDGRSFVAAVAQLPVLLGMYQVLRTGFEGARFLWLSSLARPDFWLALAVGATLALAASLNPDLPQQMRIALVLVPAVLLMLAALKFSSALGLYWTVSNCCSALQMLTVRAALRRRDRQAGARGGVA